MTYIADYDRDYSFGKLNDDRDGLTDVHTDYYAWCSTPIVTSLQEINDWASYVVYPINPNKENANV